MEKMKPQTSGRLARMTLLMLALATPVTILGQESAAENSMRREASSSDPDGKTVANVRRIIPEGTPIRFKVPDATRISRLKPGTELEATLARALFSGNQVAIPAGTRVQFIVDSAQKIKTAKSTKKIFLSAMDRAFNPFDCGHPAEYALQMREAVLLAGAATVLPLHISFLRVADSIEIEGESSGSDTKTRDKNFEATSSGERTIPAPKTMASERPKKRSSQVLMLRLESDLVVPAKFTDELELQSENNRLESNHDLKARAYLMTALSAAKNQEGDLFQARLSEPLRLGNSFLPAGTLVEGHVARRVPPRWLNRPGMLALKVDRIIPGEGEPLKLSGSLGQAEADASSRFVMDEEGTMRGRQPGLGKALVDVGIGYAVGKVADDLSEAPMRAIAAGISDASAATAARYMGFGTASIFLITRHGRDVKLSKYSEIEIRFARGPEFAGNWPAAESRDEDPRGRELRSSLPQKTTVSTQK